MDLLNYGSDEEEAASLPSVTMIPLVQANPIVAVVPHSSCGGANMGPRFLGQNQSVIVHNPTIEELFVRPVGPENPFKRGGGFAQLTGASGMGRVEAHSIDAFTFAEQYKSFERNGFAISSENEILGDVNAFQAEKAKKKSSKRKRVSDQEQEQQKLKGLATGGGGKGGKKGCVDDQVEEEEEEEEEDDLGTGPWAAPSKKEAALTEAVSTVAAAAAAKRSAKVAAEEAKKLGDEAKAEEEGDDDAQGKNIHINEPDEEAEMWEKVNERKMGYTLPPRPARGTGVEEAKSTFHGESEKDYQGRSWTKPPAGVRPDDGEHECYIPKKCVKKYTGHTKGVNMVEFFPSTGHLLLSASLDGRVKIWDVYGDRNVKRTYYGHSEAVRSIHFSNTGVQFLSSGFDRLVRLWDVETGQAVGTFTNRKMGYQVKFYPNDNNIFLMAASDNRIYQWDARTGQVCQEYNYHLQPCNTVTFFDEGRKFLSTSDDKKLLVWEFDIPVPIKYIQEPDMHSMPAIVMHPKQDFFVGQSMDNTIVTYACGEKVKQQKKKTFTGHVNAGYACQPGFSPNGKFLISGDGQGKLHFWDWRTTKIYRSFQAHDGVCMATCWHPLLPSVVASAGADGLVRLFE